MKITNKKSECTNVQDFFQTFNIIFCSVAEPEPVELKLFETRSSSKNYFLNKYLLKSVWRMLGWRKANFYLHWYGTTVKEQF